MSENSTKTITVDGKDYSYEGRLRVAGKTENQLAELVAEKFPRFSTAAQLKIVDFLLNKGKGEPVVKPLEPVAEITKAVDASRTVITLAQLKDAQTYGGMTAADLAEVAKVIQCVIEEKAKAEKLGISPEELKKRFLELDQFDAANK